MIFLTSKVVKNMVSYVSYFLNPILDWFNPPPKTTPDECKSLLPPLTTPDECKSLIERLNGLTTFSQFNNPYPDQVIENREIVLGKSKNRNDQILIKKPPCSKNYYIRSYLAKQEQLAYLISERLGLNVVPAVVAIEGFDKEIDKISETVRKHLTTGSGQDRYQGVVVQKKVNAHFILERLDHVHSGIIPRIISLILSLFRGLFFSISLNQKQLAKAVLFNIISGRTDARRDNSMIDSTGKVMEIDNEYIGSNKSNSWLFDAFSDHILSKDVIDGFLETDSSIIEDVFKDFGRRYSKERFWCPVDDQYNSIDQSRTNILNNFKRLQAFLKVNKDSVIRIRDLKQFYA